MKRKLDQIDLLLDYLDGKLDKELANEIQNSLPNDPVLSATIDGLEKLYEEHNRDREALRAYFKDAENRITNNLIKKGFKKNVPSTRKYWFILLFIGIGLLIFGWWYWDNQLGNNINIEKNENHIDTIKITNDSINLKNENIPKKNDTDQDDENTTPLKNNSKKPQDDNTKNQQPIALKYEGTFTPIPYIDKTIKTDFRGSANEVLISPSLPKDFRNTFNITQNNYYELSKAFVFSENAISNNLVFSFFNANTIEKQEKITITSTNYTHKEKLPKGLYYWSVKTKNTVEIYGSILILENDTK